MPNDSAGSEQFLFAVGGGAGATMILATLTGFPISTTHVSVGSLFDLGLVTKQADLKIVSSIALSRVLTLPCAAIIAGLTFWVTNQF